MAWALLVLGGVGLAVTISALRPVRRLALLTVPSFVFARCMAKRPLTEQNHLVEEKE